MRPVHNLRIVLLLLFVLVTFGTVGYMVIEGWPAIDALYMTVITIASVGFKEVHDLSMAGQLFTIILIMVGVGVITYAAASIIKFVVEGQLRSILGRKKLEKQIARLRGHYIICGYGRIGTHIVRELEAKPLPLVVVEREPKNCQRLSEEGILYVEGDATDDDTLIRAGIKNARGLVTAVTNDTENVYITLTARGLNPDLFILARASEDGAEMKLRRAGASKVISPYIMGAARMAQAILRPSVVDFIEIATAGRNYELQIEEIYIAADSKLDGTSLIDSGVRKDFGVIIVGIKKGNQQMLFNPAPTTTLNAGDILITLGEPTAIAQLGKIAGDQTHHA